MYSIILIIFLSVPLALSQELFEKKMVCRNRHCLENRVDFLEKEYEFMINSHFNLNNALSHKDAKLTDYQERLSEKEKIINKLESELTECTERNKDLNTTLLEIKNQTQDSEGRMRPQIDLNLPGSQTIAVGGSASFQCRVTNGDPKPTVRWTRAGGELMTSTTESRQDGVLMFTSVTGAEAGAYVCTATNEIGSTTATATLIIQDCDSDYILANDLQLCFKVVKIGKSYWNAQNHCEAAGGRLLKMDSNRKVLYFDNYLNRPEFDMWDVDIGIDGGYAIWLNGEYSNGLWVDESGNEMPNIPWEPIGPQQPFSDTCISLAYTINGHWPYNRNCDIPYAFICEKILQ